jgi:hypothetical protein
MRPLNSSVYVQVGVTPICTYGPGAHDPAPFPLHAEEPSPSVFLLSVYVSSKKHVIRRQEHKMDPIDLKL